MKRLFCILAVLLAGVCLAQDGPNVNVSQGPPVRAWTQLYFYDGSNNLEYVCYASSEQAVSVSWTKAATTLTQIVDSGNTSTVTTSAAHGLTVGSTIVITGSTGDTDLNGSYAVVTVPSTATFTITTANVTDATYTTSTLAVAYTGLQDTGSYWSIQKLYYSGTNLVKRAWANGTTSVVHACASRTSYAYR